jgi:lipopolysaccharide assembly protein A
MRWVHLAIIVILAGAMLIFGFQNLESVTVSFLGFRISIPLALLIAIIYLVGMATGGSLWSLFRWALRGARQAPAGTPADRGGRPAV